MKFRILVEEIAQKEEACKHYDDFCKREVYMQLFENLDVEKLAVFLNANTACDEEKPKDVI